MVALVNVVYSGVLECEGHIVQFVVNEDDTVKVSEIYNEKQMPSLNISIEDAIAKQDYLIKLGYSRY